MSISPAAGPWQKQKKMAAIFEQEGVDYIHLSSGTLESKSFTFPDKTDQILPEAQGVKSAVNIPVICPQHS